MSSGYEAVSERESGLIKTNLEKLQEVDDNGDTKCGFLVLKRCKVLQVLASKKTYVCLAGLSGMLLAAIFAYFNGIISTLEKRYQIPSRNIGIIMVGFETATIIGAPVLGHLLSNRHRPRWIGFSMFLLGIYCFAALLLHGVTGPGEDALLLTVEYGTSSETNSTSLAIEEEQNTLCLLNTKNNSKCDISIGSFSIQMYLFFIHFAIGLFGNLIETLGIAYMDDNILKTKMPMAFGLSYFIQMLGPAFGYTIALISLQIYITPNLTPTITEDDVRWIGAWWFGYIILGIASFVCAILIAMMPKELPRAAMRRQILTKKEDSKESKKNKTQEKTSIRELFVTYKRILSNKIISYGLISSIFHWIGFMPFWTFLPKYIEIQYRQSAAASSFFTGLIGLVFTAIGTISAGYIIQKLKLSARSMALWQIVSGVLSCVTIIAFMFLGCDGNSKNIMLTYPVGINGTNTCISNCYCDFVKYSPVCGENGFTYISPCHAGCTEQTTLSNGTKYYENCSCIPSSYHGDNFGGYAIPGSCQINCSNSLFYFMIALCLNNLLVASGTTNVLLFVIRSVAPEDKSAALSIMYSLCCIFSLIPSPIFYGWLIDQSCLVWGKTCSGTGNCWVYDSDFMRFSMNLACGLAIAAGTVMDYGVYRNVKNLVIFDEEEEKLDEELKMIELTEKRKDLSKN